MTLERLECLLVKHGLVDVRAICDPDGYDAGCTKQNVRDLYDDILKSHKDDNTERND